MSEIDANQVHRHSVFKDAVNENFRFLNLEFGFDDPNVSNDLYPQFNYTKQKIGVKITYYATRGYEMDVGIRHSDVSEDYSYFGLDYIIGASKLPKKASTKGSMSVYDIKNIKPCVKTMAERTKIYAREYLEGDVSAFRKLNQYVKILNKNYHDQYAYYHERKDAELAWNEKNMLVVAKIYTKFERKLKPFEVRRLKYARSKTKSKTSQWFERTFLSFRSSHSENPESRDE